MKTLHIDIETYSGFDLAKTGLYRYIQHPDFEVMLIGFLHGQQGKSGS